MGDLRVPGSVFLAAALGAVLAAVGCNEPYVGGDTDVTVGQKLAIEVAQGPAFVQGDVEYVDSSGRRYSGADLDYQFIDDHHVQVRIPPGSATGPGRLHLGAQDRPEGYDVELSVSRMAVFVDSSGTLYAVNVDTGRLVDAVFVGHGTVTASLLDKGAKVLATASSESAVHFFLLTGDGFRPYSPAVEDIGSGAHGAARFGRQTLVGTDQGLAWLQEGAEGSTVLKGFAGHGPVWDLKASDEAARAVSLVGFSQDATTFQERLEVVEMGGDEPVVKGAVDLPGTPGGATSVALSPDGRIAWVNNRVDDTILPVQVGDTIQAGEPVALPSGESGEGRDPFKVVAAPTGDFLAVLCVESKTLVLYRVGGDGALQSAKVFALPDVPWDAAFAEGRLYILMAWRVAVLDLGAGSPQLEDPGLPLGVGMSGLLVQP